MDKYIDLLKTLITTPSFSGEEEKAAEVIRKFLTFEKVFFYTKQNNTWAYNKYFDHNKPVILLNSHIDTVRPSVSYRLNPFEPVEEGDIIYGLGSNDAGGPLISLLATFIHFFERKDLSYNLIFAATAEEEISGSNGLEIVLPELPSLAFAIVGEPTCMSLAVAEKGLLILDCYAHGKSGHAARDEGENALYKAIEDIQILRNYRFEKSSEKLGEVKMTITQIDSGTQHNVVPDICHFVVDVRTNEFYPNNEAVNIVKGLIRSEVSPRSLKLNSSGISPYHPFVKKAKNTGLEIYGSPTTSDQAIIPFPSVKIGPGNSARSHTADEFIKKSEITKGISLYIKLLEGFNI
ncbi:MAG: M20 family metallo-hydrolase [Prolixibacteraceae bacterium]|jgi:acetylornithine deacetylase|nr:M20 family metallo-hydrolase [Prolixibacteraceae bacterium]MDD4755058.1 M20 family metallo-hydrolase [Prolixibacteraceae bacterium]NLO03375.1 M20 family metallo-hydrolase [Bacteroidales bacterium]